MIYIKSLFACICFTSIVLAQIPNFGRCPEYGKIFLHFCFQFLKWRIVDFFVNLIQDLLITQLLRKKEWPN